jgi:hypothetical protein
MAIIPTWLGPPPTEERRAARENRPRRLNGDRQFSDLTQEEREQHFDRYDEAQIPEALEGLDNTRAQLTVASARLTSILRSARSRPRQRYEQFHQLGGAIAEQYRAFLRGEFDQKIHVVQKQHLRCMTVISCDVAGH